MITLIIKAASAKAAQNYAATRGIVAVVKGNRLHGRQPRYNQYVATTADTNDFKVREWFHETNGAPFPYGTLLFFAAVQKEITTSPLTKLDGDPQ